MPKLQPMPVVRGTRPGRRGSKKLLFLLFLFFIVLMGVLFFQSSFSKIHKIEVNGHRLLTEKEVLDAAGMKTGDHFFAAGSSELERRIEELGAVESAAVTKRFPGTVRIEIKEHPVVALELNGDGGLVGLLSNGYSVTYKDSVNAAPRPLLTGWTDEQLKKSLCQALGTIPPELLTDVSEIRPSATEAYNDRILIYTRSRFEVITRIAYLSQKIALLDDYIYDMKNDGRTEGRLFLLETDYGSGFEITDQDASGNDTIQEIESIQ